MESVDKFAAGTNKLALNQNVKPATATDMLKKLKEKDLVDYKKYRKITLTTRGRKHAIEIVRKYRLWETFLFKKLGFTWMKCMRWQNNWNIFNPRSWLINR